MRFIGLLASVATTVSLLTVPVAQASAEQFCSELDATWDGARCTTLVTSWRQAERFISLDLPVPLLDDPTAGPVLRDYYRRVTAGWRATGADAPRDSSASTYYQVYPGPGSVLSVIVHENFEPFGIQANNAYRSFIFDMAKGSRLTLSEVFKPGVDPLQAISAATMPILPAALDAAAPPHPPNTYPFTVEHWTPGPDGPGYTGSYRAFALTTDEMVLYLPDAPMMRENPSHPPMQFAWSMDGGAVTVRVPLSALAESLRPEYGGI